MDVRQLLDPELKPVLGAFELPAFDADTIGAVRSSAFPGRALSGAVVRTDHEVPSCVAGDPPVPGPCAPPAGATGRLPAIFTIHGGGYVIGSYDMDDVLLDRWCPSWASSACRSSTAWRPRRRTPGRSTIAIRRCAGPTPTRTSSASTRPSSGPTASAPAAGSPRRSGCWRATAARCRWPSSSSTAPCSTTADDALHRCFRALRVERRLQRLRLALVSRRAVRDRRRPVLCRSRPGHRPAGLPPSCVVVGSIDGFRDEDVEFAQRLNQTGVPCELHVIAGLPHAYQLAPHAAAVKLADALQGRLVGAPARSRRGLDEGTRSGAPLSSAASRSELAGAARTGADHGVLDERPDQLAVEVEDVAPSVAAAVPGVGGPHLEEVPLRGGHGSW